MNGYTVPVMVIEEVFTPKPIVSFELDKAGCNNKTLNALFNGIPLEEFIWICDTDKEAWDILCVTHEGTEKVKMLKTSKGHG